MNLMVVVSLVSLAVFIMFVITFGKYLKEDIIENNYISSLYEKEIIIFANHILARAWFKNKSITFYQLELIIVFAISFILNEYPDSCYDAEKIFFSSNGFMVDRDFISIKEVRHIYESYGQQKIKDKGELENYHYSFNFIIDKLIDAPYMELLDYARKSKVFEYKIKGRYGLQNIISLWSVEFEEEILKLNVR